MAKKKQKLTRAEKAAKRKRRMEFQTIFIGGRMKRIRRPPMIDGMTVDEFIRRNADPVWLHENEMWESMEPVSLSSDADEASAPVDAEEDLPF